MLEKPFGPQGHDREHDAQPRPSARAGYATGAADAIDAGDGLDDETADWELPEWVDGLDPDELDVKPEPQARAKPETDGLAAVRRALAALDAAERGETPPATEARAAREQAAPAPAAAPPASVGDDAWGLDQPIESGMSWLMDLGEASAEGDERGGWLEERRGSEAAPGSRSRNGGRLVVLLLLAGAAFGGFRIYESFRGGTPETPVAKPTSRTSPRATPAEPALPEASPVETETPVAEASEPAGGASETAPSSRPLGNRNPYLAFTDAGRAWRSHPNAPYFQAHFSESSEQLEAPSPAGDAALVAASDRETREQLLSASDLVLLPELNSRVRIASAEDLSVIWSGTTVPLEAIDLPQRLLTPAVGRVRVVLHGGELFDGRLYAVGEQKVWLEINAGRMALVSWQIERIEHIETSAGAPSLGEKGSQRYVGLERVRVRTAGGIFYGALLNRDGDVVTLLTEDGARITLQNAVVEPAGTSRTRLIDSSGVEEASAPAPQEKPGDER